MWMTDRERTFVKLTKKYFESHEGRDGQLLDHCRSKQDALELKPNGFIVVVEDARPCILDWPPTTYTDNYYRDHPAELPEEEILKACFKHFHGETSANMLTVTYRTGKKRL